MNIELREMTIDDYEAVYALWQKSDGLDLKSDDTSRKSIIRFLERNPNLSFVAVSDGKIIGAALCGHDGRHGYIHNLAVSKAFRKQGIGKSLVGRCNYALLNIDIHRCHLHILGDNKVGIDFWNKLGWKQRVELITMTRPMPE